MTARTRKRLAQVGSFALAGLLLYLALRGVNLQDVGQALATADYRWLVPLALVALFSHLLRAWRWLLLLQAKEPAAPATEGPSDEGSPEETSSDRTSPERRATLKGAFYSVMIGYMVNYAAPRLGEVARTANLSARTRRPFSGIFGTVVIERVFDTAVLALALASTLFLLSDQLAVIDERFLTPAAQQFQRVPIEGLLLATALIFIVAALLYRWMARRALWAERVRPALRSFKGGLLSLMRTGRPTALLLSTAGIWACYGLMAYLPFLILNMAAPYHLSLVDAWCLMALGALGVAVPSPGGTGSYHYITIQALVWLFNVPDAPAATYAVLTHGAQLVLYTAVGLVCLVLQGSSLGTLQRRMRQRPDRA